MDLIGLEKWFKTTKNKNGADYQASAIRTRLHDLQADQEILGDVDKCVKNEDSMYHALIKLGKSDNPAHQRLQTALRRYWEFKMGNEFPRIKTYEKTHGIRCSE